MEQVRALQMEWERAIPLDEARDYGAPRGKSTLSIDVKHLEDGLRSILSKRE